MDRGSLLGAWIAGFALWALALLAIWTMADPAVLPDFADAPMAPVAAEAVRDNQSYIDRGLLNGMAMPGIAVRPDAPRPAPATPPAGRDLPGPGT